MDVPSFNELYANNLLPLEKLISKEYGLDCINQAMCELEEGKVARASIAMTERKCI